MSKQIKSEVYCTLEVEGTHNWPNCPFDEVAYLRDPHRHMFGIKAYKIVTHSDRDVEFIMLKHQIQKYLYDEYAFDCAIDLHRTGTFCIFGARSCEMIAQELIEQFDLSRCEVNEDNENGCILTVENNCGGCCA